MENDMLTSRPLLAVFGGSFNPPLNSHFSLAEQIVQEYSNIEKVIFVPVSQKYPKEGLIEDLHRYNMLKLVCDKNDKFIVSDIELKFERQLFTIETLEFIERDYPDYLIYFTIGTDNLKELSTWKLAEKLVSKFKIFVIERAEDNFDEIINNDIFLSNNKDAFIKLKENIRSNISSSFVREKLKNGKSIRYFTPDEVYYYIIENSLYKGN